MLSLLKARYGHILAAGFGPLALKALRQTMVEAGQSRRYENENVDRICRVFRWTASEQLIMPPVPAAMRTVEGLRRGHTEAREGSPVKPVDDAIVEVALKHLPTIVADMVRLQRLTGVRHGEICSMRTADADQGSIYSLGFPEQRCTADARQVV